MPRAVNVKKSTASGPVAKKKPAGGKRKKLYDMPEKIAEGTLLTDMAKGQWRIGPSIGTGGFGEIYSASPVGQKNYDYVVKCEPHGNGPLFVEMHFYMRNAKLEDIQRFQKERGLKALGMPYMIGNGSVEVNGQKHRFIVMPRYGSDVARHFLENGRRLPEATAYRLALQMLDVYEYIHSCGYVHADLKGANILLGYGKGGGAQAYLVDYGLASHYTTKEFKPDPKKMHNGTIEYTSRDAHQGVATMRADLEILGYNLIEWLGVELPWVQNHLLATPAKVQQAKEQLMLDVGANLKKVFPHNVPVAIADFMKYVAKMKYNEMPEYEKCRKIFESALKIMKTSNTGDLDFKLKATSSDKTSASTASTSKVKGRANTKVSAAVMDTSVEDSSVEEIYASDDDDDDVIFEPKRPVKVAPTKKLKTSKMTRKNSPLKPTMSPTGKRVLAPATHATSPNKMTSRQTPVKVTPRTTPKRKHISPVVTSATRVRPSPTKKHISPAVTSATRVRPSPTKNISQTYADTEKMPRTISSRSLRSTPVKANTHINLSPAISLSRPTTSSVSSVAMRNGKTIINDNLTPNPRAGKTYEFNFELDVSMDANVIVNVKRKKKAPPPAASTASPRTNGHHSRSRTTDTEGSTGDTPITRVRVRKLDTEEAGSSSRTPDVITKRVKL